MKKEDWYRLRNPDEIDSPALLVYPDRVASNIRTMLAIAGGPERLVPHVKTHKMAEIVRMQLEAGISKFKCATIAEAEMLSVAGAPEILLAYQLNLSKAKRWRSLLRQFPKTRFSSLVDNVASAALLNELLSDENLTAGVYIDVDAGMHRTGIAPGAALYDLYVALQSYKHLVCHGLHIYDGHIRDSGLDVRKMKVEEAFEPVYDVVRQIIAAGYPAPRIIAGGTPTFPVHAMNKREFCSPGTGLLWDFGYDALLEEQAFEFAALLLTRVISKPATGIITTDLGHKSVSAENPVSKRIVFLNLPEYEVLSQSEEHLVLQVPEPDKIRVGDTLYGVPYHICPTVALYDEAWVVQDGRVTDRWNIESRRKKITI